MSKLKEGVPIRINTAEYRQWKAQQNKKNLIRRTQRRKSVRRKRTSHITAQRIRTLNRKPFKAPEVFSFTENPNGTMEFFEGLMTFITEERHFGRALFIDISQIKVLTIDALMYLLAVINNLNKIFKKNYTFQGNFPNDPRVRGLIKASGFNRFVRLTSEEPIARSNNTVQIMSGDKVAPLMAKKMCDFVMSKGNVNKTSCKFLYNILIELMANVYSHAYSKNKSILYSRWYCFAEFDENNQILSFTFMDTGEGIPSTVRKHGWELVDFLSIREDSQYVCSAMKGEFRSKTKKEYRGKGLPMIYDVCQNDKIQNMRIITNLADVTVLHGNFDAKDREHSLRGTLFYWQIDLNRIIERI